MGEHDGHRARMKKRFLRYGLASFEDHAVLELLLFYAIPRSDTNLQAHRLIDAFGSLDGVFDATPEALMKVDGVGENAALLIRLVPEAARRYRIAREARGVVLTTPEEAGRYLLPRFLNAREETLYLVCLDPKQRVIDCRQLGTGELMMLNLNVRQITEVALMRNAAAVILAHNHPNGLAHPSQEDRDATRLVYNTLLPLHITLLDHIIVAGEDFFSMSDSNMIP